MWTPKRILLLVVGFLLFFGCYQVYHFFLGRYDGLPPLPLELRPGIDRASLPPVSVQTDTSYLAAVKEAFGEKCEEVNRRVFEWRQHGLLIATEQWKLLPTGRLLFTKVSVALFPQGGGEAREINTLRGDEAEIEFDQPIKDINEIFKRKPIAGELRGNVLLKNNRRTASPDDDLRLLTNWLKYRDDQHRIWTDAPVRMADDACGAMVTAVGLEVELLAEPPAGKPAAKGQGNISGVKRVRLDHDIRMELPDDGRSNFLAANQVPAANDPTAAKTDAVPGLVVIDAQGPFIYYAETERAEFNDRVKVLRKQQRGTKVEGEVAKYDQLDCEQLILQFVRERNPADAATTAATGSSTDPRQPTGNLTIQEAWAKGKVVELASDGEGEVKNLHATAAELHFDKGKAETTLRGGPNLFVEVNGYELRLKGQLILRHAAGQGKALQEGIAQGSGEIRLQPSTAATEKRGDPILVKWRDQLSWKVEDQQERLLFQGPCSFEDPIRGKLEASQQLVLWLEAPQPEAGAADATQPMGRKQPSRLIATGEVRLTAPELIIKRTERLSLAFVTESSETPPGLQPGAGSDEVSPLLQPPPANQSTANRTPIEVTAGWIDARLVKAGNRHELERLRAEELVQIQQTPTDPAEKPFDIRADRLDLSRLPENLYKVEVFGRPAVVQLDKLFLSGPEIKLDQQQNTVEVVGAGTMRLPTKSDFEGRELAQETDLTMEWATRMLFGDGVAHFVGNVKAEQQQARLQAGRLNVELDRKISLRRRPAGATKEEPIGLVRLVGNDGVVLERRGDKVGEYQRVRGGQLDFNNTEKVLIVAGPNGQFDLLSAETDQFGLSRGGPGNAAPQLKLTRIHFERSMQVQQQTGIVTFLSDRGDVRLLYVPTDDINLAVSPDSLPSGSLYVSCKRLIGRAGRGASGSSAQELREVRAEERVLVEAPEFMAQADLLTYDAPKERLTLEGLGGKQVTLIQQVGKGGRGNRVSSRKIIYDRRTNTFQNLDINQINIGAPPGPAR